MTTAELLAELELKGVTLFLDGDHLRYRAPAGVMEPELRSAITDQRSAIIESLRVAVSRVNVPREPCGSCHAKDWRDHPPKDGRIRTSCRRCGRFIGYRPIGA